MHHANHAAMGHPVFLNADALHLTMRRDVVALEQGVCVLRPEVTAAERKVGRGFTERRLFHHLEDLAVVHTHHPEGCGFLWIDAHQTSHRSAGSLVGFHKLPRGNGRGHHVGSMVGGHQQVVPEKYQKRSLDGMQRTRDGVAQPMLLLLFMHKEFHAVPRIEVLRVNFWAQRGHLTSTLKPRTEVLARAGDQVHTCCASMDGLFDQVRQQRDVHQRKRFLGQHRADGKHACAKPARDDERVLDRRHEGRCRRTAFQASARTHTVSELRWEAWGIAGALLVAQTFLDLVPAGPWGNGAMGTGFLGLAGFGCLYVAWFRRTFSTSGLLPTSDLWKDPAGSWPKVVGAGVFFLLLSYLAGRQEVDAWMPDPAGLVLSLIGLLAVLNGLYVGAAIGPLSEEE